MPQRYKPRKQCAHLPCNRLVLRPVARYCSIRCQHLEISRVALAGWLNGERTLTHVFPKYIRRYLTAKYGERCSLCGWAQRHSITGRVPIEVDHIDGNWRNNKEENLRLICPNCHSLTPTFRNLNRGRGRPPRGNRTQHDAIRIERRTRPVHKMPAVQALPRVTDELQLPLYDCSVADKTA
jgi:hypothetical protein